MLKGFDNQNPAILEPGIQFIRWESNTMLGRQSVDIGLQPIKVSLPPHGRKISP